jgi:hypothetical protein
MNFTWKNVKNLTDMNMLFQFKHQTAHSDLEFLEIRFKNFCKNLKKNWKNIKNLSKSVEIIS